MSRVLSPTGSISGSLSDGGVVVGSFSDLAKPIDGGWVLKVNLAKSGDCPTSALIQLFQDQDQADNGEVIIASTTVTPTSTAQDYEVSISEEQLSSLAVGRCHLSEVKIRVTAAIPECTISPCCPDIQLPDSLIASDGVSEITLTYFGGVWIGNGSLLGCEAATWTLLCLLQDDMPIWNLNTSTGNDMGSLAFGCSPIGMEFQVIAPCGNSQYAVSVSG